MLHKDLDFCFQINVYKGSMILFKPMFTEFIKCFNRDILCNFHQSRANVKSDRFKFESLFYYLRIVRPGKNNLPSLSLNFSQVHMDSIIRHFRIIKMPVIELCST